MNKEYFHNQTRVLLKVLPLVLEDSRFALKGGTAINLFIREMPRISVDIDLTYLPLQDRQTSLQAISDLLQNTADKILQNFPDLQIEKNCLVKQKLYKSLLYIVQKPILK